MGDRAVALSILIPVYNGAQFIGKTVQTLLTDLREFEGGFEILILNDGSTDATAAAAACPDARVRILNLERNLGKFGALKHGMREASGSCCIFTDADLPYESEALFYIERLINGRGFHLVIGDRSLPSSRYGTRLSLLRKITTAAFSCAVRMLVTGGLFDTQCGLKGFRADIARPLFALLNEHGFSGDVELLYIALKYNLEIKRIPVRLQRQGPSSVRVVRDGFRMLSRILRLKYNWARGKYLSNELLALSNQHYWNKF